MGEFNSVKLFTARLELVAATFEHACAELESIASLASLLEAQIEPDWPPGEYDRPAQEFFRDRLKESGPDAVGWYSWYVLYRPNPSQPSVLIGAGGYFGPPSVGGEVEIGLSVMPAWRGMGFATEIASALIKNALADTRVRGVIAHTTPANVAARTLLDKCGFRFVSKDERTGDLCFEILPESLD